MSEETDYNLISEDEDDVKYKIVRIFDRPRHRRVIRRGLTLAQAQEHLKRDSANSHTDLSSFGRRLFAKRGQWIDTYEPEVNPSWLRDELRKKGFDV